MAKKFKMLIKLSKKTIGTINYNICFHSVCIKGIPVKTPCQY